ncbi:MAG: hypothetical protein EOP11_06900 [Proteobacteria bacterium]|nr:MAG: hypothetical protein EOP11_06900 [Pseudomonadota bacterium]
MKKTIFAFGLCILGLPGFSRAADPSPPPQAEAPRREDRVEDLLETVRWRDLGAMEFAGAQRASLAEQPWSDSYWPLYAGGIAYRYADPGMRLSKDWAANERYILDNLGRGWPGELSPAEKYDRLVGDTQFTLTRWSLSQGRRHYAKRGVVADWMGLCHGWAPAAFMEKRVSKAVEVKGVGGETLLFYPSDLHALSTLQWGEASFAKKLIGGRCRTDHPARDGRGRPQAPECLDSNPGTWHLSVVNQLGGAKRALLFDATAGSEVWNYPIYKYEYHYVKDGSGERASRWQDAARPITEADRRKAPRAEGAASIVHVKMNVTYAAPTSPSAALVSTPAQDESGQEELDYELELSGAGEILGGEWISTEHPDFLWLPAENARALSEQDKFLDGIGENESWPAGAIMPMQWQISARAASREGQPLARVVQELLRRGR